MIRRQLAGLIATGLVCLIASSAASATPRYRTCVHNRQQIIKARPTLTCGHARRIAKAGLYVDGDDGAHFRLFGRRWQCVTIKRPDHGRHTLLGCFTPTATKHPEAHPRALVTLLLEKPAD